MFEERVIEGACGDSESVVTLLSYRATVAADPPVLALLSQALVAHSIEVDNEIERRMPHFTMKYGSSNPAFGSPWLISSGLWFNFLRHVGPGMIPVSELAARSGYPAARVSSAVAGLVRWGYVVHHAHPNDSRPKPPKADWVVNPTSIGKRWHETFPEIIDNVEVSWAKRYGIDAISALRAALTAEVSAVGSPSAQFMPMLDAEHRTPVLEPDPPEPEPFCLASLMARVILTEAHRLEPELPLGLALSANVVRVARDAGVLIRDLPRRSGVAKQEATTMVNFLVRHDEAVIEADPSATNAKRLHLTETGTAAADAYAGAVSGWDPPELRRSLEALPMSVNDLHADGGWRQKVRPPETLPHYPVVTGHGGYPDGS